MMFLCEISAKWHPRYSCTDSSVSLTEGSVGCDNLRYFTSFASVFGGIESVVKPIRTG